MDHRLTMLTIKSELFNIWTLQANSLTYEEAFEAVKPLMFKHFGVRNVEFMIYYNDTFIPFSARGYESNMKESVSVKIDRLGATLTGESLISILRSNGYEDVDDYFLFTGTDNEPVGILLFQTSRRLKVFASSPYGSELVESIRKLILNIRKVYILERKEESFRLLFNVTELFNATMDSGVILDGTAQAVSEFLPVFDVELKLAHERLDVSKKYKLFDHNNERSAALDAFLTGELTTDQDADLGVSMVNAPIRGRQGIYGILQVKGPFDFKIMQMQRDFIRVLANAAGNALENASLYEQSHRLIEDLQLVNETSRKINANLPFDDMVLLLKGMLLRAFNPSEIGFVFKDIGENFIVSDVSSIFFRQKQCVQYVNYAKQQLLHYKSELFEAQYSQTIQQEVPYESFIAVPIVNREEIIGFIMLLHTERYHFPFESFKLMRSLIDHSSLAFSNSILRDQLQELVDKDNLTKLYTRSYLDKVIEKSMMCDARGVFLMMDVDNFKQVNDVHGHAVGDDVLQSIAKTILSLVGKRGAAARWGGEEIAVYLPHESLEEGTELAGQILKCIPQATDPRVTVSIGIKSWDQNDKPSFQEIFQNADTALYSAKYNGKNQVVIHPFIAEGTDCKLI